MCYSWGWRENADVVLNVGLHRVSQSDNKNVFNENLYDR